MDLNTYKCSYCDYSSQYHSNIYRHSRKKHPDKQHPSLANKEEDRTETQPPPPPPREIEDSEMSYSDLEEMIDCKVKEILQQQNLDVPPTMRKNVVKNLMNSRGATIAAGMCLAYLLLMNAPIIVNAIKMLISKNCPPPSLQRGGQPQLTQEQMMELIMKKQMTQTQPPQPQPTPQSQVNQLADLTD